MQAEGPAGAQQRFWISGEYWLEVTPERREDKRVRLRVRMLEGNHVELQAGILAEPDAPVIFGGPPHGDGVLILILWARPTSGPNEVEDRAPWRESP